MRGPAPLFHIFILCLLCLATRSVVDATSAQTAQSSGSQPDLYAQAEVLYKEKKYEEVVQLLSAPADAEPGNFQVNILLAQAELKQCERLKAEGDGSYETLVHSPYNRAQRLYRIDRTRPEPYYIAARALVINGRPEKAYRTIKKALYFRPHDPEYLKTLGDIYMAKEKNDHRANRNDVLIWRSEARAAYKKALSELGDGSGSEELKEEIERKLKGL
jgi:tetratricopeptide (TPR) repeat protein